MQELVDRLLKQFQASILDKVEYQGEMTLLADARQIVPLLRHLKDSEGFNSLVDISCAHWPESGQIEVVYQVRSLSTRNQLRIKAALPEEAPTVETACGIWRAANWLEREVYDLMGVRFEGHPDLKRIMLPEDFVGHPLRKEFPMEGDDEWRNYLE